MRNNFNHHIAPFVSQELTAARQARADQHVLKVFAHLERAHVLGQASTWQHVRVHALMLAWGVRNRNAKEVLGQVLRIAGAATKTAIGLVPTGNTGGSNVSPFKKLPIAHDLQSKITAALKG